MNTSNKLKINESVKIEKRLRDEVFLLDPFHRVYFNYAVFDKDTNSLHGSQYSLHYQAGMISIR
jgi:hypothetical protein